GNNWYFGSSDSDTIFGGTGADSIFGNGGQDTISGGQGNDYISGGGDDDVYIFANGDGQDVLADAGGNDTIVFDSSVAVSSVSYSQSGNDLIIHYGTGSDQITVTGFFSGSSAQIEQIVFADGTVQDADYITAYVGGHM